MLGVYCLCFIKKFIRPICEALLSFILKQIYIYLFSWGCLQSVWNKVCVCVCTCVYACACPGETSSTWTLSKSSRDVANRSILHIYLLQSLLVVLVSDELQMGRARVRLFSAVAFRSGTACFNGGGSLLQRSGPRPDAMVWLLPLWRGRTRSFCRGLNYWTEAVRTF